MSFIRRLPVHADWLIVTQFSRRLVRGSASGLNREPEPWNRGVESSLQANFDKRRTFGYLDKCTGLTYCYTGTMKSFKQRLKKNEVNINVRYTFYCFEKLVKTLDQAHPTQQKLVEKTSKRRQCLTSEQRQNLVEK